MRNLKREAVLACSLAVILSLVSFGSARTSQEDRNSGFSTNPPADYNGTTSNVVDH